MFDIIDGFKARIAEEGISVFLHAEGKLGHSCRTPVTNLSSVFIDFAESCNLPIVPVRFVGGLPVEEMESTLDFPFGYTRQDYYMGRPISVEELKAMPYADRRKHVMNAINNLGPSNEEEAPHTPNPDFENEIKAWMKEKNVSEAQAIMYKALESTTDKTDDVAMQIVRRAAGEKIEFADDVIGKWLSQVAHNLYEVKL